jgi:hypothetical protein
MNPSTELLGAAVLALGTVDPPARGMAVHDSDEIGGEPILVIRDDDPLPPGWREFE